MPRFLRTRRAYQASRLRAIARTAFSKARRGRLSLRGRGAYTYDNPGPWGTWGRRIGGIVGAGLGAGASMAIGKSAPASALMSAGSAAGSKLGSYAHYAGRYFGSGAYRSARGRLSQAMPSFGRGDESTEIVFREYLGDIISASVALSFSIDHFPIQVGMERTFPWLSAIANNYQMYQLVQCMFHFESFSGNALDSVNTALGVVVAATDYDSTSIPFQTRAQMENSAFSMSKKPSVSFNVPIECSPRQSFSNNKLYVRSSAPPANSDLKTYDVGKFSIASLGCQGTNVNLGSLYVSYRVRLFKPILQPSLNLQLAAIYRNPTGVTAAQPFGTIGAEIKTFDNIGLTFTTTTCTIPKDVLPSRCILMCVWNVIGANTGSVTPPTVAVSSNLTGVGYFNNATAALLDWPSPTGTQAEAGLNHLLLYADEEQGSATIQIVITTAPASITSMDFHLYQINASILPLVL